ncbi:MAG TPA: hypothetical protein DCM44_01385 [Pantoea sp.]|nr:hypothetical protein A6J33_002250 [Pantoea sp. FDAARGOS_194]HAK33606.1 hypothetical protein [Pantoea sp.]
MLRQFISRVLYRTFRSLLSLYGPSLLTITFALLQIWLFPNAPLWPIPLFFFSVIFLFKW